MRDKNLTERIESILYAHGVGNSGDVAKSVMDEVNTLEAALQAMVTAYEYSPPCHDWEAKAAAHNLADRALKGN